MITHYTYRNMKMLLLATTALLLLTAYTAESINETLLAYDSPHLSIHQCHLSERSRQRRSYYVPKEPLYCPPCEQIHCYKQRKKRLYCKGGYTVGVCGCCRVCAKVEGEQCGGDHNYLGRCDSGLTCEPQPAKEVTFMKDGVKTVYKVHRGICRKAQQKVQPPERCKPKCDPDYCNRNPRAICSAKENVEKHNQCQGICQHTSCRACRFVEPEQQCPSCHVNDFKCLRDFGRCIRKKICKPKRYPGGNVMAVKKTKSSFLCSVPECPL